MDIRFDRYPHGKRRALTMSYDDGRIFDRRLVDIFNKHGFKGTFHLNSGLFDSGNYLSKTEIKSLYAGHEVSAHSVTHPFLDQCPREKIVTEIIDDRKELEDLVGYPVRGMSYPYGTYNDLVLSILPSLGIEYARTVITHGWFAHPKNFLLWETTGHHGACKDPALLERFFNDAGWNCMPLMYIWGHSIEFEHGGCWGDIEDFCKRAGSNSDVWYATNIEVYDYLQAVKRLVFSAKADMVYNPSAVSVWFSADKRVVEVKAGESKKNINNP